jgi:hypothetical protein
MPRIPAVAVIAVSLMFLALAPAAAQDDVVVEANAPDPALCTLDARTIEEIRELVAAGTPVPAVSPTPLPDPFVMPEGMALSEEERAEVEKDLLRAISCFNTGDPLKVFAVYTDDYVVELIERLGGLTDEAELVLTNIRPMETSDYIVVLAILDAVLLDDGRVLVVVSGDDPSDESPPGPRVFYLEEVLPGRWLIDEFFEVELQEGG